MKNIHDGHRARLREMITAVGLNNIPEINQLEYILSFVIKRKDTNALAHLLMEKYKSMYAVISADPEELMEVSGIGKSAAYFLGSLLPISKCVVEGAKQHYTLFSVQDCICFFLHECVTPTAEMFMVCSVDSKGKLLHKFRYSNQSIEDISVNYAAIIKDLQAHNARYIVTGHNHPDGSPFPSENDVRFFKKFQELLETLGMNLRENIVLGIGGGYSTTTESVISYRSLTCPIPIKFTNH